MGILGSSRFRFAAYRGRYFLLHFRAPSQWCKFMETAGVSMRTFYEFFAGGGMARAGLGEGWRCLFANGFDEKKAASYAANWGAEHLVVEDVAKVRVAALPGEADLAWASFPCQDLSLAGDGAGLKGDRSGTFWPFWRLVERLAQQGHPPMATVLENFCSASSRACEKLTA
jgi:DNA (cytosine-5)-methyltransferase 1